MREIGTGPAGAQHFSRAQWDNAASVKGEIRLRNGKPDGDVLYSSTRTLGGRFVGGLRDLFSSKAANAQRQTQKAADAKQAVAELRTYLGPFADRILSQAGLSDHTRLTGDDVGEVLRLADDFSFTVDELRGEKTDHAAASFQDRLDDPSTLVSRRKVRALENDVVDLFGKLKDGGDKFARVGRFDKLRKRLEKFETASQPLSSLTAGARAAKAVARYDAVVRRGPDGDSSKALKLAIQVKTLANGIAVNEFNNGRSQNAVARMLFRAHAAELKQSHTPAQLKLAEQLGSNTVLLDLAAGRLTVDKAMLAVRTMAQKAELSPKAMLSLMGEQFDAEIGSLSRDELKAIEVNKDDISDGNFDFTEMPLSGDIVTKFYDHIVKPGSDHAAGPISYAPRTLDRFAELGLQAEAWGDETGLESVDAMIDGALNAAKARADGKGDATPAKAEDRSRPLPWVQKGHAKLFDDIKQPGQTDRLKRVTGSLPLPGESGSRGLTERQYALIREVRADAAGGRAPDGSVILPLRDRPIAGRGTTPKQEVLAQMVQRYGLSSTAQAESILKKAEAWLESAPITLTVPGHLMFKDGPQLVRGTAYKATQEGNTRSFSTQDVNARLGGANSGDAFAVPVSEGGGGRGENYVAWRIEKDDDETRHVGLSRSEQAKFAAVNPNFDKTHGFEGDSSAYGYFHLRLKPEVRERAVFNFNKTRELRADMTMILHDMMEDKHSSGSVTAKGSANKRMTQFDAIVHNALGLRDIVHSPNLHFEVEIFGDLDLVNDVEEVRMPSTSVMDDKKPVTTDEINSNMRQFYESKGIKVGTWDHDAIKAINEIPSRSDELKQLVRAAVV